MWMDFGWQFPLSPPFNLRKIKRENGHRILWCIWTLTSMSNRLEHISPKRTYTDVVLETIFNPPPTHLTFTTSHVLCWFLHLVQHGVLPHVSGTFLIPTFTDSETDSTILQSIYHLLDHHIICVRSFHLDWNQHEKLERER